MDIGIATDIANVILYVGSILGIFLTILKIKELLEKRQRIGIDFYAIGSRYRDRTKEEFEHNWYGDDAEKLPEKIPQIFFEFCLINKSSRPIGIRHVNIYWKKPRFEGIYGDAEYCLVHSADQIGTISLTEPFELKGVEKKFKWTLEPTGPLCINFYKKMKEIEKENKKEGIPVSFKIVVTTNQNKNTTRNINWTLFPFS